MADPALSPGLADKDRQGVTAEEAVEAERRARIAALRAAFVARLGYEPDFEAPRSFNEKINHRKLHDRNPLFPRMVDKIEVRRVVAEILGPARARALFLPVLARTDRPTIAWLARQVARDGPGVAIKANHGCGWNLFLRAGQTHDLRAVRRRLVRWLGRTYGVDLMEWAYGLVPPCIFAEPLMLWPDGRPADDLKFSVFGGRCHMVQIEQDRFANPTQVFLDRDGRRLPLRMEKTGTSAFRGLPGGFTRMLRLAEEIGARFDYVRVDFMFNAAGFALNELTIYRGSGLNPFDPLSWDRRLGDLWEMRIVPRRFGQA
jgi:hypothetical protein